MADTTDEELMDIVYNNDSVVRVTSRVMSDSELALKSLGTTADQINKYNKVVEYGTLAWCCVMTTGGVAVFLWVYLYALDVLGPVFGGVIPWCILVCTVFGAATGKSMAETWLDNKGMKIAEDRLVPKIKQLNTSIMRLQTLLSIIAINRHVERNTAQCINSQKVTVTAVSLVATDIYLACTSLTEKRSLIAEQVSIETLPLLTQKLQSVYEMIMTSEISGYNKTATTV